MCVVGRNLETKKESKGGGGVGEEAGRILVSVDRNPPNNCTNFEGRCDIHHFYISVQWSGIDRDCGVCVCVC